MPTHRGFSAWVSSEGQVLDEYLVAVDPNTHQVQCWIPSEEGKTFAVHWMDSGSNVDSCSFISLDGYMVPGRFLFGKGTAFRGGVRTGPSSEKPFMFSKVEETNTATSSEVPNKDGGTITLKIKLIQRVSSRGANEIQFLPENRSGRHAAGQLRVGYGEERQTWLQSPTTWHFPPVSSHVTFIFRYRSRDFLLGQGIMSEPHVPTIPAVPAPVPRKPRSKRCAPRRNDSRSTVASSPTAASSSITPGSSTTASSPIEALPPDRLPVSPSPTSSPKITKTGLNHLSSSMKKAFFPGMGCLRPSKDKMRTVSSRANNGSWQGLISFNDAESGEDTIFVTQFGSPPVQQPVAKSHDPAPDPSPDPGDEQWNT